MANQKPIFFTMQPVIGGDIPGSSPFDDENNWRSAYMSFMFDELEDAISDCDETNSDFAQAVFDGNIEDYSPQYVVAGRVDELGSIYFDQVAYNPEDAEVDYPQQMTLEQVYEAFGMSPPNDVPKL